jgi:TetR/AcrR family transcriptional regulator
MTPTTRSRRTRDAEASKAAILEAARRVFVEEGLSGARINRIAQEADVPQGLLYHYFESKEQLFHTVVHDVLEPYFRSTIEMLEQGDGAMGGELLERAIRLKFEFLRENPDVVRLLAWAGSARIRAKVPELLDQRLCESPMNLGVQRLREGQEAGLIRSDVNPLHVIKMFLDLCLHWFIGLHDFCLDSGVDPEDRDQVDALNDAHLDHICKLLVSGLEPTGKKS